MTYKNQLILIMPGKNLQYTIYRHNNKLSDYGNQKVNKTLGNNNKMNRQAAVTHV